MSDWLFHLISIVVVVLGGWYSSWHAMRYSVRDLNRWRKEKDEADRKRDEVIRTLEARARDLRERLRQFPPHRHLKKEDVIYPRLPGGGPEDT